MVQTLEEAGVKHCYGIVGDTLNHFTDSIAKSSISWVHVRHEEVGGFAAGADALMSGNLTACAGSCGPGSLHFINGLFESHRNGAPVVLIASQLSNEDTGYVDFPQYVDFKAVYGSCSVYCEEIKHPSQARHIMTLACQAAITQGGVAVVIMPTNISAQHTDDNLHFRTLNPQPVLTPVKGELQQIAELLNATKKVMIYTGAGAKGAHDIVVKTAEKLKAPIGHSSRGKDFIEYDNPYNMGMPGMLGHKSCMHALTQCEVLLILGADFTWPQYYPKNAKIIQIDHRATHIGRRYPVELGAVGDIKPTMEALYGLLGTNDDRQFLDECLKVKAESDKIRTHEEREGKNGLIHPQHLTAVLNKHADDDAYFTADGGSPMVWILRHIDVNGKRRTLTSLLHGTMANAMPQALGIQKAFPGKQVISLSGDGGLAMLMGDLLTAVQEKLPIKVVVFNNRSLNFVQLEQQVEGLLDNFTDLSNPDFAKVAQSIGWYGATVSHCDQLEQAVTDFLKQEGPALLNVHTNPNELMMPPEVEFAQAKGLALYGAKAVLAGRFGDVADMVKNNVFE